MLKLVAEETHTWQEYKDVGGQALHARERQVKGLGRAGNRAQSNLFLTQHPNSLPFMLRKYFGAIDIFTHSTERFLSS